jgi:hypothetical protein
MNFRDGTCYNLYSWKWNNNPKYIKFLLFSFVERHLVNLLFINVKNDVHSYLEGLIEEFKVGIIFFF